MDLKGKERGILKLEPRPRVAADTKAELTPQGSCDRPLSSPQPSIDRLSVTWADPSSMASSGVNLFHLPTDTPVSNEVKFSPSGGDASEDEDYSASLSAVLRQRRASVRRSRKGRSRRSSSPFLADENRPRRRSSVFTTSSGDTAISIEEQPVVTQEQIFEYIHLNKEVLGSVKLQRLAMRRKLKIVKQAKSYIKRHEGKLQERLVQSKSTRDIYARFNILLATKWQQLKREAANTSNLLIPWELRIKEIESHFGSVVASYFTFLRWLFWVNLVIASILLVFVIIPEYLTAKPLQDGERKIIMDDEKRNATNLLTLWEFEGILKYSPIFYGYYTNVERPEYRMPLAYFLTGVVVYIYSFVAILRKMAENSRMSKLSEKEDECIFSWKLFTGWDFMIGNTETAHNRIASVILGFKEALLEEAEKKRNLRNWKILSLRAIVNICVMILLAVSAYAVVTVVTRSDGNTKLRSWWRENETTIVVTVISITFPIFFELLGFLEHYHPRKQLRLQLARIMLLNLLNLYSLIFALFSKIEGMSRELVSLQPTLQMNALPMSDAALNINESFLKNAPIYSESCVEVMIPCLPCNLFNIPDNLQTSNYLSQSFTDPTESTTYEVYYNNENEMKNKKKNSFYDNIPAENLIQDQSGPLDERLISKELERLRNISATLVSAETYDTSSEVDDSDTYDSNYDILSSNGDTVPETLSTYTETVPTYDLASEKTFSTTPYFDMYSSITLNTESTYSTKLTDIDKNISDYDYTSDDLDNFTTAPVKLTTDLVQQTTEENQEKNEINQKFIFDYDTSPNPTQWLDHFTTESTIRNVSMTPSKNTHLGNIQLCPNITFNYSISCAGRNITQIIMLSECVIVDMKCYLNKCVQNINASSNITNITMINTVYIDKNNRKVYNLTLATKKKLLKLCWETMFGQELVKLTMMDLVFVVLGTLFIDFFRALFVRYMNRCWCWDLEKKFPEYGDFKIAENILHLINNQGMVWMGMFFSPGLVVLNVVKLMIMMYLRSWAVMTCNVPHEVVFRVSKSNNFYLALLLTMLFLCVLPVGYTIVWVKPSWHCGPFSEYDKIYKILTNNIYKVLPKTLNFALEYIASPAIVIPLLVLLILIIYYLTSLTNSLREANNDLKNQLRRERTEERRKMFQLADTRRRGGACSIDNTPFARWKKALPSLPLSKSIDSDEKKTSVDEEIKETTKNFKRRGIFAKIVGLAIDKKCDTNNIDKTTDNNDEESDPDFHECLPKEILKIKDIVISKDRDSKKKPSVEFKTTDSKSKKEDNMPILKSNKANNSIESELAQYDVLDEEQDKATKNVKKINKLQNSESSNQSKQSDSIVSVIPVITISTTESDDEILQGLKEKNKLLPDVQNKNVKETYEKQQEKEVLKKEQKSRLKRISNCSDFKSLRRQSSVDSENGNRNLKDDFHKSSEVGHKYQYSL